MRLAGTIIAIISIVSAAWLAGCGTGGTTGGGKADAVILLINDLRAGSSLPALIKDDVLCAVAQTYSKTWETLKPNPPSYSATFGGTTLQQRLQNAGLTPTQYDETGVVDYVSGSASAAFSLMNTTKLTSTLYTKVGVGHDRYFCEV